MITTSIEVRKSRLFTCTALALCLAACAGGGGGGSSGGSGSGAGGADAFRTQEFLASGGLDQIRAAEGFAQITGVQGGAGVRIAVIGSGIDGNNSELNVVQTGVFNGEGGRTNLITTATAGVAAARAGNGGIQGVAFNADLVDLQADTAAQRGVLNTGRVRTSILATAGEPASDPNDLFESDIILLGLEDDLAFSTGNSGFIQFGAALSEANNRGKIIISSAGDFTAGVGSQFDVLTANVAVAVSGNGIIVASVDANNQLASNSRACGSTASFCLVAPGVGIVSTAPGGGTAAVSSSAIAAGHVAGAAAVVQAAFPGIAQGDIRNRLLNTATDLGAAGRDTTFGSGLLNLENALSPQGSLEISTSTSINGSSSEVSATSLNLGSGFALDRNGQSLLTRAVVLDDQDFPFGFDLNSAQDVQERPTGLASFVSTGQSSIGHAETTPYGTLSFAAADTAFSAYNDPHGAAFFSSDTTLQEQEEQPQIRLTSDSGDGFSSFVSLNGSNRTDAGLSKALAANDAELFQEGSFFSTFENLADQQSGMGGAFDLDETTKLTLSAFTSDQQDDDGDAALQKIELTHKAFGDVELRLGYGWLQEDGRFLGSESDGAFGTSASGDSQFVTASILAPITDGVRLFGTYTRGEASISTGRTSLLSDWSTAKVESFGAGMIAKDVAIESDTLTLMAGQPLRVEEASATLTVPTGRTESGGVLNESERVDLAPESREIALEAIYSFDVNDDGDNLAMGTFVRLNPDHDPNANPDTGFGIRYSMSW